MNSKDNIINRIINDMKAWKHDQELHIVDQVCPKCKREINPNFFSRTNKF